MKAAAVLQYLDVQPSTPSRSFLNQIIAAWGSHIPWESAWRIARHQVHGGPEDYARLPDAFFDSAITYGTGGTCFESNFALKTLLTDLGFQCELAFCDMEKELPNPHCAVTVQHDGELLLADVGYPIPAAFPLDPSEVTTLDTTVYLYRVEPVAPNRWEISRVRGDFFQKNFTLKTEPIDEKAFLTRLLHDHEPDGLFLDNVIVAKTFPTHILRYSEDRGLVRRSWGKEEFLTLTPDEQADLPATLARLFHYEESILRAALMRVPLA